VDVDVVKVVDEIIVVDLEVNVVVLVVLPVAIAVAVEVTVETAYGQQSGLSFTHPIKAA
jgi:hypothetical protein